MKVLTVPTQYRPRRGVPKDTLRHGREGLMAHVAAVIEGELRRLDQQWQRAGLDQFVDVMVQGGIAAWHDEERLEPRERALFHRQSYELSVAVAELKTLLDPEHWITLHKALGAVALIARQRMEDPAADRVLRKLHTTAATEETKARGQRAAEIIEEEFNKLREKYLDNDFRKDGPWKTGHSRELQRAIKQRREQEDLQPYKPEAEADTIGRYLAKLPLFGLTS